LEKNILGQIFGKKYFAQLMRNFFSRESDSTVANVRLSVRLSVTETPQPLRIAPIDHRAYQPLSLSTINLLAI